MNIHCIEGAPVVVVGVACSSSSGLLPMAGSTSAAPMSLMQAKPHPQPGLLGPLPPAMVVTQGAGQGVGVYPSQQGGYYPVPPPQQQQAPGSGAGHPPIPGVPLYQPRHPQTGPGGANYY